MAVLVAVLVAAFLVSRSCGSTEAEVGQSRAIEIAKEEVAFTPDRTMVRLLKRGFQAREYWAVSLSRRQPDGSLTDVTVVVVDAQTGEVVEIRREAP